MLHVLKTSMKSFHQIWNNEKHFEIRKDDRNYMENDYCILKEFNIKSFSGRNILISITKINIPKNTFEGLSKDYCAFSFKILAFWFD
jgi:hypothetical protein